jgi:hypothetical protein
MTTNIKKEEKETELERVREKRREEKRKWKEPFSTTQMERYWVLLEEVALQ